MPTENLRIFWACQQVAMAADGTSTFVPLHGVQSVGITTNFNLEQVFELGQISIYQLVEQIPEVEVTMEKVLDGKALLYHQATAGATSGTLVGRSNIKTIVGLALFPDTGVSASGTPVAEVHMSGMSISNLSYTFPIDGSATESVTLIGNDKVWYEVADGDASSISGGFPGNDDLPWSGGVQHRWDMVFAPMSGSPSGVDANGATNAYCTVLPTDLHGISSSGTNNRDVDGNFGAHIQTITVSADLGRTPVFEQGRKQFYTRPINFPVEVRTDIEVLSTRGDSISGDEAGGHNGAPAGSNLKNQTIRIQMADGTRIDLGQTNKLNTSSYGGGDAGQSSNATNRYSYITYNNLTVSHPADPSSL